MITEEAEQVAVDRAVVDCAVVIVTFNNGRDIGALLDSLAAGAGGRTLRTIVVDNGSTDGTLDAVRARTAPNAGTGLRGPNAEPGVTLVESGANVGYAAAINIGRAHARPCGAVLVLNPDLRVEPGAIATLLDAATDTGRRGPNAQHGVGVVVPALVDGDGHRLRSLRRDPTIRRALGEALLGDRRPDRPAWAQEMVRDDAAYDHRHPVDWATGAALLVTDACDRAVGDWDESFFLYSEEVDHALRARDAGYRIDYVPEAVAVHHEGGSGTSADLVALMAVNRVRLHRRRHGALAAAGYRAAMIGHALLRLGQPGQRAALAALLGRPRSPWLRSVLTTGRPPT